MSTYNSLVTWFVDGLQRNSEKLIFNRNNTWIIWKINLLYIYKKIYHAFQWTKKNTWGCILIWYRLIWFPTLKNYRGCILFLYWHNMLPTLTQIMDVIIIMDKINWYIAFPIHVSPWYLITFLSHVTTQIETCLLVLYNCTCRDLCIHPLSS